MIERERRDGELGNGRSLFALRDYQGSLSSPLAPESGDRGRDTRPAGNRYAARVTERLHAHFEGMRERALTSVQVRAPADFDPHDILRDVESSSGAEGDNGGNGFEAVMLAQAARSRAVSPEGECTTMPLTFPSLRITNSIDTFPCFSSGG